MTQHSHRQLLGIEYCGKAYSGWQRQTNSHSVQQALETVLSEIANHSVETICAGRTDARVHATSQYVHFDTLTERPEKAWLMGANSMLPDDISVFCAKSVNQDFHARFSALDRSYVYYIYNHRQPAATLAGMTTWINYSLDEHLMHQAAQALLGEHDFSSFRSSQCQSKSRHRFVSDISVQRYDKLVVIQITANAFLHHMVRNIVGSLLEVGRGKHCSEWLAELIEEKDRTKAGATAPPDGLYLCRVRYPSQYQMNEALNYPLLLASNFIHR